MSTREKLYDTDGHLDEALTPDGLPRPEYERVLDAIAERPRAAREATWGRARELGATFGEGKGAVPFKVDAVPRIITAEEWDPLERALAQRAQALNRYVLDVYSERKIVAAGVVPERVIETAPLLEPDLDGVELGPAPATVAGFDLVRGPDGLLRVLEDNVRTPSGIAYAHAARHAADPWLARVIEPTRRTFDEFFTALAEALVETADRDRDPPTIVVLSDGPESYAWYEHRLVGETVGLIPATRDDLSLRDGRVWLDRDGGREVDVVWRRTDEDVLRDPDGEPTWVGELLLEPLLAGRVRVANAFGTGVADDKLAHAYVEDMVRFYLGEEPLIESVPTLDLGTHENREHVRDQLEDLVVKPRGSAGGKGVVIGSQASPAERRELAEKIDARPGDFVAQAIVPLSRHPTICGDRIEPRHVDLRAFAISRAGSTTVAPGGLTRVAYERGLLLVNSSQGGGGKDTWVVG